MVKWRFSGFQTNPRFFPQAGNRRTLPVTAQPDSAMKILFLTAAYPPLTSIGHNNRAGQVAEALAARRHHVQVLTSNHRLPPFGMSGERGVSRDLVLHNSNGDVPAAAESYQRILHREAHNLEVLWHRVRRARPDVVYVWNMDGLSNSLLYSLAEHGVPTVFDLHSEWVTPEALQTDPWVRFWKEGGDTGRKLKRMLLRLNGSRRRMLRRIPLPDPGRLPLRHGYLCSGFLKRRLEAGGVREVADFPVLPPALNTGRLHPKKEYGCRRRFIWAGRLTESKAPGLALEAVRILRRKNVTVSLDFFAMGAPGARKALREQIEADNLADRVRIRGIRPGKLAAHFPNYDAFIFTGKEAEAFPITPLEALLSGLPGIFADEGGLRELERGEEYVYFFPTGRAEALARSMEAFIARPDCGKKLAEQALDLLRPRHSLSFTVSEIESILTDAKDSESVAVSQKRSRAKIDK